MSSTDEQLEEDAFIWGNYHDTTENYGAGLEMVVDTVYTADENGGGTTHGVHKDIF